MHTRVSIDSCFSQPVIPVIWDPSAQRDRIAQASTVILQGGSIVDLPRVLKQFENAPLDRVRILVHIDLIHGLENNEAGLEYLAQMPRVQGIVTVHARLAKPARRLKLLTIIRLFLSDSRAAERWLDVASQSKADAIELLPAAAAIQVSDDFRHCPLPRITGGLCRSENDVKQALAAGFRAVTATNADLWRLNGGRGNRPGATLRR